MGLATNLSYAHDEHGSNTVWTDSAGKPVLSANGECVRAIDFKELGKESCHDKDIVEESVEAVAKVEPAAEPVPKAEPVYMFERKQYQVLFATDSNLLNAEGKAHLNQLVAFAKNAYHVSALQVTGHADTRGSASYNMDLSAQRVEVVKAYLEAMGVRTTATMAMGENRPVMVNGKEDMDASRRADVVVRAKVIKQQ
jgi:OOP family OmpA-OmpF porin